MSENQQPLDEEQAVSDVQEQETLPAAAEDTPPAAQDENAPAILDAEPEEEEDIDPADVKIFGMKRHVFQLTCLGAAVGYILCGLVGILSEKMQGTGLGDILAKSPSTTVWAVVVACCRLLYRLASGEKARSCSCGRTGRTRAAPMIQTHNFPFGAVWKESLCKQALFSCLRNKKEPRRVLFTAHRC